MYTSLTIFLSDQTAVQYGNLKTYTNVVALTEKADNNKVDEVHCLSNIFRRLLFMKPHTAMLI